MKRIVIALAALCLAATSFAQDYERRYNALVERVGWSGVGVETLLENWRKAEPENEQLLTAGFLFYLSKSQSSEVVVKQVPKYLGQEPILSLKDSSGVDQYYYELVKYDDEMFGNAVQELDKAISLHPDKLEYRVMKANAYLSYERESPDLALSNLIALAHSYNSGETVWTYEGEPINDDDFAGLMQDYCYSMYNLGSPGAYEAFGKLSERMLVYFPDNTDFISNMGSYHIVVTQSYKTALKYFDKVLKIKPDDKVAIMNSIVAARKSEDKKKEVKYLKMLMKYGDESEKLQAQGRIKALGK